AARGPPPAPEPTTTNSGSTLAVDTEVSAGRAHRRDGGTSPPEFLQRHADNHERGAEPEQRGGAMNRNALNTAATSSATAAPRAAAQSIQKPTIKRPVAITAQASVYRTFSTGCEVAKSKFTAPFAEWKWLAIRRLTRDHHSKSPATEKALSS